MRYIVIVLSLLVLSGCSTFYLGEKGRPYHGTKHALSALYCTPYNSTHEKETDKPLDVGVLGKAAGVIFYGSLNGIDLLSSVILDTIILPKKLLDIGNQDEKYSHREPNNIHPAITDCRGNTTLGDTFGSI